MKISLNWLRDWVDTGDDVPALAHALTMAGLEIEGIAAAGPSLPGVVVGEVKSVTKHPDAEKLNVCVVSTGAEDFQIVCGAPNVRVGMKAPLATIGAKLPNGTEIKRAKLRGVESFGMLCSARELGINEEASGLYDLPADLKPGQDLVGALGLDDTIFEVNLTPNRGDAMSVQGVAREVAAARGKLLHPPAIEPVVATITDTFPVRIETAKSADAPVGCYKFVGRVIRGIRPNVPSPFWMQERLRRAGLRPISAVVDITNYVMLELGAPMHAYDRAKLASGINVRFAKPNEKLKLLDGREIELTPDVLVIADERSILGLAGVMGGEDSGIADGTVDVFFECAFFDPNDVAGRGRRYGLITDASQRFERGVDPELQERAIERATQLLLSSAGGKAGPLVVTRASRAFPAPAPIRLRHARVEHVLGAKIDASIVQSLLERLGMVVSGSAGQWQVTPPTWRFDVRIEEDLIEEVARLHGFENIPEAAEIGAHEPSPWTETHIRNERASDLLVDRGYQEAINYAFTDQAYQVALCPEPAVALSNAISAELAVMRVSLWPGLLAALGSNQRRQQPRVRLFEVGRRYSKDAETEVIAGVATGAVLPEQWGAEARKVDFFDIKADVEALIGLTGAAEEFRFVAESHPALHPGQSARIYRGERPVGWLGAVHPEHSKRLDLTYPVFVFELETAAGLAAVIPEFEEISRYPAIRRDIAAIVDEGLPVEAVRAVVQQSAGNLLKRLTVLSVYQGQQLQKGKKSIALGLQLQDTSRTLTDNEADALVAQVVEQLGRQLNATLRDQ
ncbi:phenylalanine--tRNA ligase subunit beta [Steroidobacter agaridevorans]|uniref:phenylalanine--tRNA ligase subunit beta n=1 Tax=Steroidobacter agaridevorans TaxID=2695856 RepID=UPI001321201D|nr:phenylalanine--tRNA ligase subunit beta [Steroidobacter agaridevorans]GFE85050.1 phenylalanine--tRNA ligase beta subunit [Steroidobacter agaridevorans]